MHSAPCAHALRKLLAGLLASEEFDAVIDESWLVTWPTENTAVVICAGVVGGATLSTFRYAPTQDGSYRPLVEQPCVKSGVVLRLSQLDERRRPALETMQVKAPAKNRLLRGHRAAVEAVVFDVHGEALYSGAADGSVLVWPFQPERQPVVLKGHQDAVTSLAFNQHCKMLASASKDKTVRLWQLRVQAKSEILKAHTACVRCVSFSSSGKLLLTASDDKTVKAWLPKSQQFLFSLCGHSNWVRACSFTSDDQLAASAGDDSTVRLWDVEVHKAVHAFHGHAAAVHTLAFHPISRLVASGAADGAIKLWDLRSRQPVQHYYAHNGVVTQLAFHPLGLWLLSGSQDGKLRLWDSTTGRPMYTLGSAQGGSINSVAVSAHGNFFASGGHDHHVHIWHAPACKDAAKHQPTSNVSQPVSCEHGQMQSGTAGCHPGGPGVPCFGHGEEASGRSADATQQQIQGWSDVAALPTAPALHGSENLELMMQQIHDLDRRMKLLMHKVQSSEALIRQVGSHPLPLATC